VGGAVDARRVQTAVVGSGTSEIPVVLPTEPIELDVFRRIHHGETFWCGVLLGDCGSKLMSRLYTDRVCHFAHIRLAGDRPCRRARRDESSADHLYIKQGLTNWLDEQGLTAHGSFSAAEGVASLVDVSVPGRPSLRVHLDDRVPPNWGAPGATSSRRQELLLGPGVPADPHVVAICRYVHRIRCTSQGAIRQVSIGTETLGGRVAWYSLDECRMTPEGLVTPRIEEIRQRSSLARPRDQDDEAEATPVVPPSQAMSANSPEIANFVRDLAAAQKSRDARQVRALCDYGNRMSHRLVGDSLVTVHGAVEQARRWLDTRGQKRSRVFSVLREAVERPAGRDRETLRELLRRAETVSARDATSAERSLISRGKRLYGELVREAKGSTGRSSVRRRRRGRGDEVTREVPRHPPKPDLARDEIDQVTAVGAPVVVNDQPPSRAEELTHLMRAAIENEDAEQLRALCKEASEREFTGSGPGRKELRMVAAVARSRLQHPERYAALAELRRDLAGLSTRGAAMPKEDLAAAVAVLEERACAAGGLVTSYDRTAISAWKRILDEL
jgi:hypothetical protein